MQGLQRQVKEYEPFRISDQDKLRLYEIVKDAVTLEKQSSLEPPRLHFLTFPDQSVDAVEFQEVLKHAFNEAGKETLAHHNLAITSTHLDGTPWEGIIIQVNDLQHPPVIAERLFKFLRQIGIKVWSHEGSGYGANDIVIWSHKPSYVELPLRVQQTQSAFRPRAQRNAFRRHDARLQSRLFALGING